MGVTDADGGSDLALDDRLGQRLLDDAAVELFGGKPHRFQLPVERLFGHGIFLRLGGELFGQFFGELAIRFVDTVGQDLGDDQSLE